MFLANFPELSSQLSLLHYFLTWNILLSHQSKFSPSFQLQVQFFFLLLIFFFFKRSILGVPVVMQRK